MSEVNEHIHEAPQGPVHYWVHPADDAADANSPWLVFLHGLSADHTLFDQQVAYFKGRYPLLVWDAPAHAASRPCSDFNYRAGAQALVGIMDELGIESAVFVGQSMGGYHTQALIAEHPERARAFVGIDTCPFGERYYSRSDLWWVQHMEGLCKLYPGKTLVRAIARSVGATEATRRNMRVALGHYTKAELCHLLGMGYGAFVRENRDIRIDCPTLILVGDSDKTGKVRTYCDAWAQATGFPEAVVPHAAHNSNFDNPAFVNDQIERFVESAVCDRGA